MKHPLPATFFPAMVCSIGSSNCYICQGQRTGYCDYELNFYNTRKNQINKFYYHSLCVADQLIGIITDEQHRDEISDMIMDSSTKCESYYDENIRCENPNCRWHGDRARELHAMSDINFDKVSNLMNGGKLNARSILINTWHGRILKCSLAQIYRQKLAHAISHIDNIVV